MDVPVDKKILPDANRISGKHIAEYAKSSPNQGYAKAGLKAEELLKHFEEVKKKILSGVKK